MREKQLEKTGSRTAQVQVVRHPFRFHQLRSPHDSQSSQWIEGEGNTVLLYVESYSPLMHKLLKIHKRGPAAAALTLLPHTRSPFHPPNKGPEMKLDSHLLHTLVQETPQAGIETTFIITFIVYHLQTDRRSSLLKT